MEDPLLKALNEKQKEAVKATEGPVLVLAGAGSGKTRVLTHRIAYILQQKLAYPNEILAVTFTNKAAGEIKDRIRQNLSSQSGKYSLQWAGTFHSICAKILRIEGEKVGLSKSFVIYDPTDQLKLIKDIMKDLDISTKNYSPKGILSVISSAKNELVSPEEFKINTFGPFQETVARIYPIYQQSLSKSQAVDFDDLIGKVIYLFKNELKVLEKYQKLFKYILVDEYQDTNYAQYMLIKLLADKHKNLFVVGDDAQSIYKWRGADIRNILNFEKDYKNTKLIKLEQNYRSTKVILEATNKIIKNNVEQKPKKLWTKNKEGELITIYSLHDAKEEAKEIASKIRSIGTNLNEVAILYRTNAQSRELEEAMINHNIPYRLIGNVKFYDRKEIKDILAYIRLLANLKDDINFERIINFPKRGIGKQSVAKLKILAKSSSLSLLEFIQQNKNSLKSNFTPKQTNALISLGELFERLTENLAKQNLLEIIKQLLEETKILEEYNDQTEEGQGRIENIKEFLNFTTKYKDHVAQEILDNFLEVISLLQDYSKEGASNSQAKVNLMTIHSAKGLEFQTVFVVGLEENLFPHSRSYVDPNELEEERRLAYVAFTRAKERLILTYVKNRQMMGTINQTIVSRFISELPSNLVEFVDSGEMGSDWLEIEDDIDHERSQDFINSDYTPGTKVRNQYFGIGKIISIDEDLIVIDFEKAGRKELATEYARLEKI